MRSRHDAGPARTNFKVSVMKAYFFFAVFFVAAFFAAFFLAAIMLTTFHAVRDLPVALLGITRRITPASSLTSRWRGRHTV